MSKYTWQEFEALCKKYPLFESGEMEKICDMKAYFIKHPDELLLGREFKKLGCTPDDVVYLLKASIRTDRAGLGFVIP